MGSSRRGAFACAGWVMVACASVPASSARARMNSTSFPDSACGAHVCGAAGIPTEMRTAVPARRRSSCGRSAVRRNGWMVPARLNTALLVPCTQSGSTVARDFSTNRPTSGLHCDSSAGMPGRGDAATCPAGKIARHPPPRTHSMESRSARAFAARSPPKMSTKKHLPRASVEVSSMRFARIRTSGRARSRIQHTHAASRNPNGWFAVTTSGPDFGTRAKSASATSSVTSMARAKRSPGPASGANIRNARSAVRSRNSSPNARRSDGITARPTADAESSSTDVGSLTVLSWERR